MLNVPFNQVKPGLLNRIFKHSDISVLEEDIYQWGILRLLIVEESLFENRFLLLDGYARWRVAKKLGIRKLPIVIMGISEHRLLLLKEKYA